MKISYPNDECKDKYENTCSSLCKEYLHVPLEIQIEAGKNKLFNGSKFGKGRYKPKAIGENNLLKV